MYRDFKIVTVTPAGRKEYLELLIPQLLAYKTDGVLDECHLWLNTLDVSDLKYMIELENKHPNFIKLISLPGECRHSASIYKFFKYCVEEKTIYVRFDDDVVVLDDVHAFKRFLDFRIDNPFYFMVFANILNNAVTTHILQRLCRLDISIGVSGYACLDEIGWKSPDFAAHVHNQILTTLTTEHSFRRYYLNSPWILFNRERYSINCIAWIGSHFKDVCDGIVGEDEEQEISVMMPIRYGLCNIIFGDYCVVHYAFGPQREGLDKARYLDKYKDILVKQGVLS